MKSCFLVHLSSGNAAVMTLAFTNWPDKSDVIQVLELKELFSLRNLVKKSTWPTNRMGRRVFGEIVIEAVPITDNDKRGT